MTKASNSTPAIPSIDDVIGAIERRFVDGVIIHGGIDGELADNVAGVITGEVGADVLDLLAYSRGCHAAAEAMRAQGHPCSGLMHAMGQDLIMRAASQLSELVANGVHLSGVTRH